MHHTAPTSFLFQAYGSTILLFAGIFTLVHRADPKAWDGMATEGKEADVDYVVKSFIIFIYFSVQTMTSVGFGDVHPLYWYNYLLVSGEMLMGLLYSVAILGRGLEVIASGSTGGRHLASRSSRVEAGPDGDGEDQDLLVPNDDPSINV